MSLTTRVTKEHDRCASSPNGKTTRKLADALENKILDRTAKVCVVGLGYVGLPFAVEQARAGFSVVGIEKNPDKCAQVNRGENYIPLVAKTELEALVKAKKLKAMADSSGAATADVIIIAVPTPVTRSLIPNLQDIEDATRSLVPYLRPGVLVCLQSTTFPGTTEDVVRPILESNGLKAERDFFLSYSPERMDPGNKNYAAKSIPRIVSGVGPFSKNLTDCYYSQSIEKTVPVSGTQAAELAKIFENTFRAVNLALVNEFARLCHRMGLNTWEILDAAFTKPYGIMPFYPGPGVGGHCTPVDPHYLEWKAKELNFYTQFIDLAGRINRGMPRFVCEKAMRILMDSGVLPSHAKVLILGVTYKLDVPDCRNSPAAEVMREFKEENIAVKYYDPYIPVFHDESIQLVGEPELTQSLVEQQDLIVIVTDHSSVDYEWLTRHANRILDTRNATKNVQAMRQKITLL